VENIMACTHEFWQRESFVATDGACPLCAAAQHEADARKIAELEAGYEIQMRKCDAAQAKNESDQKVIAALREALLDLLPLIERANAGHEICWEGCGYGIRRLLGINEQSTDE
jgi:hypothetical protein